MRLLLALALLAMALPVEAATRRIAVVVGSNAGSGDRPALRFAETDAGKLARVLTELGQVEPGDLMLLQGRPLAEIERALELARARVEEARRSPDLRTVLLFYFSGHSDGVAMEIGTERLEFAALKERLAATGADLRVTIIDSCKSGAALLLKGGKPAPAFAIRLTDELTTSGEAVLASSAADENALESKEVMGSFFTHHLVSGLRGAADASGDLQVTLTEAYAYAWARTVSSTAATIHGPQHPAYDYRLSGQGELVLTHLQQPDAGLELPQGFARAVITDLARDQVVAELQPGSPRRVALAAGNYGVKLFRGDEGFGGRVRLDSRGVRSVGWDELAPLKRTQVSSKGGEVRAAVQPKEPEDDPLSLTLGVGGSTGVAEGLGAMLGLRLAFEPFSPGGGYLALEAATGSAASFSESAVYLRGGYGLAVRANRITVQAGIELGPGVIWQVVRNGDGAFSFIATAGPRLEARYQLTGPLHLTAGAGASGLLLQIDGGLGLSWVASAQAGLSVEL